MTLTVHLPDNTESALKAKAEANGVSAEEYVQQVVERDLGEPSAPFWKTFTKEVHALPDDVFDRLPHDGAAEHDHYLYGSPKRNS